MVVKPLSICSWQRVKQHRCKLLLVVFVVKQDRITYVVSSRLNSGLKLTLAQTYSKGQKITLSSLQSMFWWPKLIYVSGTSLIFDANAYCYACHSRFAGFFFRYVEYNFTNKSLVMFECFSNLFKWLWQLRVEIHMLNKVGFSQLTEIWINCYTITVYFVA